MLAMWFFNLTRPQNEKLSFWGPHLSPHIHGTFFIIMWLYILLERVFRSFIPTAKVWFTPSRTVARIYRRLWGWTLFWRFQVLGRQPGNKSSCTVSSCNRESTDRSIASILPFYVLFERFCHIHTIHSCQPGKAWLGVNHAFAKGANELNALTESMYIYALCIYSGTSNNRLPILWKPP